MKNLEIRELKVDLKENELNIKEGNIKAKRIKLREMEETVEKKSATLKAQVCLYLS